MGQSVLVFVSHSSEDKEALIEPLVRELEDCYINVWLDKRKILPGDNLRKSIFRDGLDKADVALIFFTQNSLKSSWVDREIKHVLREETKKGNNFDLSKIISIFDSKETYEEISDRYPELTDDLLHLMPENYSKVQLGQLVSAIWSKYLSLQGGDIETQKQLLSKDKELFQKEREIDSFKKQIEELKNKSSNSKSITEFESYYNSGKIDDFIRQKSAVLKMHGSYAKDIPNADAAIAFGLLSTSGARYVVSEKGKKFFEWCLINK
ncbi:TIR domain-containing protein [Vibrio antiquarius]|uniref:toll/interleukin-1 receptor domain-containing protein n=1 Tax=Vibrio diabolicus TaxID=50719 RepID=UPI00293F822C|nr:TIR domain-containing protein [Vibrio diabolicus]MDV5087179.1 TIR domain-containing protein [Vibrio diabolicus]